MSDYFSGENHLHFAAVIMELSHVSVTQKHKPR